MLQSAEAVLCPPELQDGTFAVWSQQVSVLCVGLQHLRNPWFFPEASVVEGGILLPLKYFRVKALASQF